MVHTNYLLKRIGGIIPTLLGLTVLIFFISRVLPGDPVRAALGETATQEAVERTRREMGLDEPVPIQFMDWFVGFIQGDWGISLRTNNNVFSDLMLRLPATIELIIVAMGFAILLAIPLGTIAAMNKDRWQDHGSRLTSLIGVSIPRWWLAILFQVIFVAWIGLFPLAGRLSSDVSPPGRITGLYTIDSLLQLDLVTFFDATHHLILPGIALGFASTAQIMRLIRSDMIEEMREDYALAAQAYGLPRFLIVYKYLLKNAFSSSLTIIGLGFAAMLGNAFLVEFVFSWPGVGRYGARAVINQDFNGIVGITVLVGIGFALANLVVDLLYAVLDPRIGIRRGSGT